MTVHPAADDGQLHRFRWITTHDASRCYTLPDTVEANIPRVGGLGAHDWARGHLVELHQRLGGTPLSVHYRELDVLPVGIEVTATLRGREGKTVTVVSRAESHPYGPRGDRWELTVDGIRPPGGSHSRPPTLPYMAFLVYLHIGRLGRTPQENLPAPVSRFAVTPSPGAVVVGGRP